MHSGGHQPYRRGPRETGTPLQRMSMGKPLSMPNPMDQRRQLQKGAGGRSAGPQTLLSGILEDLAARRAAAGH